MLESNPTRRLEQDNRVWRETRREPIPETLHIVRRHEPLPRLAVRDAIERDRELADTGYDLDRRSERVTGERFVQPRSTRAQLEHRAENRDALSAAPRVFQELERGAG